MPTTENTERTSTMSNDLIDRTALCALLAEAIRDSRAASYTPFRALDEARLKVQSTATQLHAEGKLDEARELLVAAAETETAAYSQYRGKWADHVLAVVVKRERFKGGRTVEPGDVVLAAPELDEVDSIGPAPDYAPRTVELRSIRSARMGSDALVPPRKVSL